MINNRHELQIKMSTKTYYIEIGWNFKTWIKLTYFSDNTDINYLQLSKIIQYFKPIYNMFCTQTCKDRLTWHILKEADKEMSYL